MNPSSPKFLIMAKKQPDFFSEPLLILNPQKKILKQYSRHLKKQKVITTN